MKDFDSDGIEGVLVVFVVVPVILLGLVVVASPIIAIVGGAIAVATSPESASTLAMSLTVEGALVSTLANSAALPILYYGIVEHFDAEKTEHEEGKRNKVIRLTTLVALIFIAIILAACLVIMIVNHCHTVYNGAAVGVPTIIMGALSLCTIGSAVFLKIYGR